ncbi:MAG: hypothetical protein KGS09_09090 [Nitrospirae bacterium]|nr:hypothetical protein [Nitrospirota bacterium]MDE3048473.1 hypothetical protein [Nitrospirota bacterium]MDE3218607.1 hypothetical protein [Nitrospirota bacterium]
MSVGKLSDPASGFLKPIPIIPLMVLVIHPKELRLDRAAAIPSGRNIVQVIR